MGLLNILLKDDRKKHYSQMYDLREEVELLIRDNIIKMNTVDSMRYQSVEFIGRTTKMTVLDERGWAEDKGLYDRLILEYQEETGELMQRWSKSL